MTVELCPEGQPVNDFHVMSFARAAWQQGHDIKVSSEIVILAFRVLVRRGEIPPYDGVVFIHKDSSRTYRIKIDRYGECSEHPLGWADSASQLLYELV